MKIERDTTICVASINGKLVKYDAAHNTRDASYNPDVFDYIGQGFIFSVNGIVQGYTEKDVCHFWIEKSQ